MVGRRVRSDAGELSLVAVLTGIAVTVVIAAAGRTSRGMMSQAQTQAKLVDATQWIVQDARCGDFVRHLAEGRTW